MQMHLRPCGNKPEECSVHPNPKDDDRNGRAAQSGLLSILSKRPGVQEFNS